MMEGINSNHMSLDTQVDQLAELLYGESSQAQGMSQPHIPVQGPIKTKTSKDFRCDTCDRYFKEASHYTNHKKSAACNRKRIKKKAKNSKQTTPKPYQCNICGSKFCDKGNVILHLEKSHHTHNQLWSEIKNGAVCEPGKQFQDLSYYQSVYNAPYSNYVQNQTVIAQREVFQPNTNAKEASKCTYCESKFFSSSCLEAHIAEVHCNDQLSGKIYILESKIGQKSFQCSLCDMKLESHKTVISHLGSEHNLNHAIYLDSKKHKKEKLTKSHSQGYQCEYCYKYFSFRGDLVRHKLKDKNSLCGLCGFLNCSDTQVALHIYSNHNHLLPKKSLQPPSSPCSMPGMKCAICGHINNSGLSYIHHLMSHGSLSVSCMKCVDTKFSNLWSICSHIVKLHINQVVKIHVTTDSELSYTVFLTPNIVKDYLIEDFWDCTARYMLCTTCNIITNEIYFDEHIKCHDEDQLDDLRYQYFPVFSVSALESKNIALICEECSISHNETKVMIDHILKNHFSCRMTLAMPTNKHFSIAIFSPIDKAL